ncbi:N-acetylglucosamine-6-phosphate deacetylase [Stieleria varia]|uniref:N-acetylglucosamine-6-phosphate deacetylase n=1 Tax=Stieleria varia TaxID=2528005 RepID=A0A5C6A5B7_9BACT|nr:amidohydrolase family protein [Stieleria varia]TWT94626.1 N-acetylglucosamine-6-phosphate deacetylase [Stieleria varia]
MSGYIDLQVNGYAGIDFNAKTITDQQWIDVCKRLSDDGVDQILATVITAPFPEMILRVRHIADVIERLPEVRERVAGIHVEGPFLNPETGYVGAHPVDAVRKADQSMAERLLDSGNGHVRLVTLAPESDSGAEVTRFLTDRGICVAAGHSNATLDQLKESIDNGLKLFTHLGNGCPGELPRHDNIIQRVLSVADQIAVSFIADGHHVPPFALRNYLDVMPDANIIIVTDAISAAGLGPGKFQLAGQTVTVDEDGAAWSADRTHFAGSAATMPEMMAVLTDKVGVSVEQAKRWMSDNPRRLLNTTSFNDNTVQ